MAHVDMVSKCSSTASNFSLLHQLKNYSSLTRYLGEPEDASAFKCEIAIRRGGGGVTGKSSKSHSNFESGSFATSGHHDETELKYSGRVHSIRIPPHRVILTGCLLRWDQYFNISLQAPVNFVTLRFPKNT